ncbi:MAG: glycosyltransferase 87 family protein [Planctomycetota bacterium]
MKILLFSLLASVTLVGYGALATMGSQSPKEMPLGLLLILLLWLAIPALAVAHWLPRLPRKQAPLWAMVGVAVAARLFFFAVDPYFSDDVYRYLWDGRVQAAGMQPYGVNPQDPSLDEVELNWPEEEWVRGRVNHPHVATIYPPLLELVFQLVARLGGGLTLWRAVLLIVELATVWLIVRVLVFRKQDPRQVVLYLWHPLPIVELAWSAHAEALAVLLLLGGVVALGEGRKWCAAILVGLGGAAKLLPFGYLPYLWRRARWGPLGLALGVAGLTLLPFLGVDKDALTGLKAYAESWYFNDMLFRPLGWLLGIDVKDRSLFATQFLRCALLGAWVATCGYGMLKVRDPFRAAAWVVGGFLILTPTLHPWYLLWMLPFAIINASRGWLLLSVTVLLAYWVKYAEWELKEWVELWPVRAMEFLPPLLLVLWDRDRRRASPGGPAETPAR